VAAHAPLLHLLVLFLSATPTPSPERADREAWVMGTRVRVAVEAASKDEAARIAEVALRTIEAAEALLSTWRDESPLSALNRAEVGRRTDAPGPLLAVLDEALDWSARTGGAFDPAIGPLVDAWGLRGKPRVPGAAELLAALELSGADAFDIDADAGTATRVRSGVWIDAGGFGKGAALRDVRALVVEAGAQRALIDLGGQVLALSGDESGWDVRIAHPHRRNEPAVPLRLVNVSAATSGASERPGHLVDPRTGHPVRNWGSVTVVDPDPMVADILSTALYVMGPDEGLAWASRQSDVSALFLTVEDGGIVASWTPPMARWMAEPTPSTRPRPDSADR
jgi:thiamine biosynthesis lipoprotein